MNELNNAAWLYPSLSGMGRTANATDILTEWTSDEVGEKLLVQLSWETSASTYIPFRKVCVCV